MSNYSVVGLLSAEELAAWRGLLRAHASLTRALDAELLDAHGLPLTSYEVLLYVADSPEGRMRMSELAESVLLSRSGLTRLVDRLAKAGLLERVRCDEDARGWYAVITDKGRTLFQDARETHLSGVRRLFLSRLTAEERERLGEVFARLEAG
jgi:DNA-binding MarR family transcriptional regulator